MFTFESLELILYYSTRLCDRRPLTRVRRVSLFLKEVFDATIIRYFESYPLTSVEEVERLPHPQVRLSVVADEYTLEEFKKYAPRVVSLSVKGVSTYSLSEFTSLKHLTLKGCTGSIDVLTSFQLTSLILKGCSFFNFTPLKKIETLKQFTVIAHNSEYLIVL